MLPLLLLSGVLWPVEAIPMGLQWLSMIFPTRHMATAVRAMLLRDWTLHWDVALGFIVAIIYMSFFFTMASKSLSARIKY